MSFLKGICYQPLPPGYDPSTANNTYVFFGSDIAYPPMTPLWGTEYSSELGSGCGPSSDHPCRDDLSTLKAMGVELIRLYDWEPRNIHLAFLDRCADMGFKVLAPVSNYFVRPDQGLPKKADNVVALISSYSNAEKTDYHEAIAGIIVGNEPRLNGFDVNNCIEFTVAYAEAEERDYSHYRRLPIGHPVDFNEYGGTYPCWGFWDPLLAGLKGRKDILDRLFLAPQTYNPRNYLFDDVGEGKGGYVDLTYERYGKPILFTEIGLDRTKRDYQDIVEQQLLGCIDYGVKHPDRLSGSCFFQFADKVWLPKGSTEGSHGAFTHGQTMFTVRYGLNDFTHWDSEPRNVEEMSVDKLEPTPLFDAVRKAYTGA